MQHLIIHTDVGADDAVAIMMAPRHPEVQVEAITTVTGNVPVEQATRNARDITELCGADVPVYQGMDQRIRMTLRPTNCRCHTIRSSARTRCRWRRGRSQNSRSDCSRRRC